MLESRRLRVALIPDKPIALGRQHVENYPATVSRTQCFAELNKDGTVLVSARGMHEIAIKRSDENYHHFLVNGDFATLNPGDSLSLYCEFVKGKDQLIPRDWLNFKTIVETNPSQSVSHTIAPAAENPLLFKRVADSAAQKSPPSSSSSPFFTLPSPSEHDCKRKAALQLSSRTSNYSDVDIHRENQKDFDTTKTTKKIINTRNKITTNDTTTAGNKTVDDHHQQSDSPYFTPSPRTPVDETKRGKREANSSDDAMETAITRLMCLTGEPRSLVETTMEAAAGNANMAYGFLNPTPPRKRRRKGKEVPGPKDWFKGNRIWMNCLRGDGKDKLGLSLKDIMACENVQRAFLTSFGWNGEATIKMFSDVWRQGFPLTIVTDYKRMGEDKQQPGIYRPWPAAWPDLMVVRPWFPHYTPTIGCFHPKLTVLQLTDRLRVIISSANLNDMDLCQSSQQIWVQDFPLRDIQGSNYSADHGEINGDFGADLHEFMDRMLWYAEEMPPPLPQDHSASERLQAIPPVWQRNMQALLLMLDKDSVSTPKRRKARKRRHPDSTDAHLSSSRPKKKEMDPKEKRTRAYIALLESGGNLSAAMEILSKATRSGSKKKRRISHSRSADNVAKGWKDAFKLYDFSQCKAKLVSSVPGFHKRQWATKFGQLRLKNLVSEIIGYTWSKSQDPETGTGPIEVDVCTSSLGKICPKFLDQVRRTTGAWSKEGDKGLVNIAWPSYESVIQKEYYGSPYILHLNEKTLNSKQFTKKGVFCKFHPPRRHRIKRISHAKMILGWWRGTQKLAYVYAGSHNFSVNAWGSIVLGEDGRNEIHINSYELGVFLRDVSITKISTPCQVPLSHFLYESSDTPWSSNRLRRRLRYRRFDVLESSAAPKEKDIEKKKSQPTVVVRLCDFDKTHPISLWTERTNRVLKSKLISSGWCSGLGFPLREEDTFGDTHSALRKASITRPQVRLMLLVPKLSAPRFGNRNIVRRTGDLGSDYTDHTTKRLLSTLHILNSSNVQPIMNKHGGLLIVQEDGSCMHAMETAYEVLKHTPHIRINRKHRYPLLVMFGLDSPNPMYTRTLYCLNWMDMGKLGAVKVAENLRLYVQSHAGGKY
ncbi:hypothetical protein AAMO2058_000066500 [Amorphochlora amoebiformis]